MNLFHTRRDAGNSKNEAESRKTGLRFFLMCFRG